MSDKFFNPISKRWEGPQLQAGGANVAAATVLVPIITAATAVGAGPWVPVSQYKAGASFTAFLQGGTTPTVSVAIDTSLDQVNILPAGVGTLAPTPTAPAAASSTLPLMYVRANVTAITGGGNVTVQMGAST